MRRTARRDVVRSGMREFESSRSSQPVRRPETLPSTMPQRPANGGLLRIAYRSPGSGIGVSGSKIADSLRRIFEIFPFSGDWGRRPGSICTAWPGRQCNAPHSPPCSAANWERRTRTVAPYLQSSLREKPPIGSSRLLQQNLPTTEADGHHFNTQHHSPRAACER
jgi:hypothetical protein